MLHQLSVAIKTLLTVIVAGAVVIAAFYIAWVLLILVFLLLVGGLAWLFYNREEVIDWFDYED